MPRDPEWSFYKDGTDGDKAYVYGAEYETHTFSGFKKTLAEHDVPCAVCLVRNRSAVNMFPGMYKVNLNFTLLLTFVLMPFMVSIYFSFDLLDRIMFGHKC